MIDTLIIIGTFIIIMILVFSVAEAGADIICEGIMRAHEKIQEVECDQD